MVTKTFENLESTSEDSEVFARPETSYINSCQKFIIPERTFERQYASYYISRLGTNTRNLQEEARKKWGSDIPIKQICDISGDEKVIVIGTIFKQMELHPSVLREISEEHNLIPQPVCEEFTNEDDYLILEDNVQRVILCGNIDPHMHVTGINVAVYGYTEERKRFFVEEFCFPFSSEPISRPIIEENRYVMLVSGFGLGDPNVLFPLQLLIDFVTGLLGSKNDQKKFSQLVRIIVAGNSIGQVSKDFFAKNKILTRKTKAATIEGVKVLDDFLSQLVSSVDLDLMPGEFDPANHMMPQQPLHPCMFPKSSGFSTFHVVTNPYDATIDGVRFLGSSGQNIKDIKAFSRISEPIDILEKTLDWSHMSPTSPDTLNCYPFLDEDPFIISEYPHVYFTGNMSKLGVRYYGNKSHTIMISIPKFQDSYTAVLINLRTLEAEPLMFDSIAPR